MTGVARNRGDGPFAPTCSLSVYGKRRIGRARSSAPRGAPAGPTLTGAGAPPGAFGASRPPRRPPCSLSSIRSRSRSRGPAAREKVAALLSRMTRLFAGKAVQHRRLTGYRSPRRYRPRSSTIRPRALVVPFGRCSRDPYTVPGGAVVDAVAEVNAGIVLVIFLSMPETLRK